MARETIGSSSHPCKSSAPCRHSRRRRCLDSSHQQLRRRRGVRAESSSSDRRPHVTDRDRRRSPTALSPGRCRRRPYGEHFTASCQSRTGLSAVAPLTRLAAYLCLGRALDTSSSGRHSAAQQRGLSRAALQRNAQPANKNCKQERLSPSQEKRDACTLNGICITG